MIQTPESFCIIMLMCIVYISSEVIFNCQEDMGQQRIFKRYPNFLVTLVATGTTGIAFSVATKFLNAHDSYWLVVLILATIATLMFAKNLREKVDLKAYSSLIAAVLIYVIQLTTFGGIIFIFWCVSLTSGIREPPAQSLALLFG
jgi:predicted membrane channel-forming protein YqfA (hemolysin III family)